MLKIGIDAHVITDIYQGSRTHLLNIIREIGNLDRKNKYFIFSFSAKTTKELFPFSNFYHVEIPSLNPLHRLLFYFPLKIKQYDLDIFHSQYIIPFAKKVSHIVTIHDVLFEDYPQYFSPFFVLRSKLLVKRSARLSKVIFTVSEYSAKRIASVYKIPNEKIVLTPNAVGESFLRKYDNNLINNIIKRLNIKKPYILTVSRLDKRKNLETLLKVFKKLHSNKLKDFSLVIVGEKTEKILKYSSESPYIKSLGTIKDEVLPLIYQGASIFIFPSKAEGFGLPILEAMASGIPVVCSRIEALVEVGRDAALYFDPSSEEDLEEKIMEILERPLLKGALIKRGYENAKRYSWKKTAKTMLETYDKLK